MLTFPTSGLCGLCGGDREPALLLREGPSDVSLWPHPGLACLGASRAVGNSAEKERRCQASPRQRLCGWPANEAQMRVSGRQIRGDARKECDHFLLKCVPSSPTPRPCFITSFADDLKLGSQSFPSIGCQVSAMRA